MKVDTLSMPDGIHAQWEKFIKTGKYDACEIRPQIVESWFRCHHAGVNPYDTSFHQSLNEEGLNKVLKEKEKLIKVAKPFMDNLYKFVKGSGFVVALTNENGYIMEMFCDEDTMQNPMTRNFFRGASWREEEAGTNAIGTALITGRPM
jgi:sigma-54 dependent transcriptional regulator, acetoin dehydrogenase operon transcriptional activator AcoR